MKKLTFIALTLIFLITFTACGQKPTDAPAPSADTQPVTQDDDIKSSDEAPEETPDNSYDNASKDDTPDDIGESGEFTEINANSLDELEDLVTGDVEKTLGSITSSFEELSGKINTYSAYCKNVDKVEKFYENTYEIQKKLNIRMRQYAYAYGKLILDSDEDMDDMYDDLDEIYDVIYNDALDNIYDEIYDGVLDDAYDAFYDGIIDDAFDDHEYSEVSDIASDEYKMLSSTRSDVYKDLSSTRSDIYSFYSDMRSKIFSGKNEKAAKILTDFKEDIEKLIK